MTTRTETTTVCLPLKHLCLQSNDLHSSDDDDADWGEETSEEAVRQRMEALSGGLGGLVIDNDLEKSEEDRINIFYKFVVNKKNAGPINQGVGAKEVIAEADR